MTTIYEIMLAADLYARHESSPFRDDLVQLITQALAEARADGAREMREAAAQACGETYTMPVSHGDVITEVQRPCYPAGMTAENIRALPLPTKREPVRLSSDVLLDKVRNFGGGRSMTLVEFARAIETAVLAANGLTK